MKWIGLKKPAGYVQWLTNDHSTVAKTWHTIVTYKFFQIVRSIQNF